VKTFIIAEAGVNHNGRLDLAKRLIDVAAEAGADAVKFQTFRADLLVRRNTPKAEYQRETTGKSESQYEMLKRLELTPDDFKKLMQHCQKKKIVFLSSPFALESIDMLNKLGLRIFKIPSGEITNLPYLRKIGSLKKKIILSTGMAYAREIKDALKILIKAGTDKKNITLLHCNTEYPTDVKDVNLRAMLTLQKAFNVQIGYSDHTLGIEVPIAAVALGATVIEKHFTLDKKMKGPDHKASLEPGELKAMVNAIRNVEIALGDGIKKPSDSEKKNIPVVRRSIVAATEIKKGELFSAKNLTVKRPGSGISPMQWDKVIGRRAKRNFLAEEMIAI